MGEWNNLNIPFSNLAYIDGEKKLNRQKKITFSIGIPFIENIHQFYFTEKQQLKSRLSIDEIGFYTLKNKEEGNVISNFEDEINRALISYYLEGTYLYVDYKSDDSGILKRNNGVESQKITAEIIENGPVGQFLSLTGSIKVNENILEFIENWGEIQLVLDLKTSSLFDIDQEYSFLINSDVAEQGLMSIRDPQKGHVYEAYFNVNKNWSRNAFSLNDILIEEGNRGMSEYDPVSIRYIWSIPEKKLREAAVTGVLDFSINMDELVLED